MLAQTLCVSDFFSDEQTEQRSHAILSLFDIIAGCDATDFYDSMINALGCNVLAASGLVERIGELLQLLSVRSMNPLTYDSPEEKKKRKTVASRLLCLVRVVSRSSAIPTATRHETLRRLLAFSQGDDHQRQSAPLNENGSDETSIRSLDMLIGALAALCAFGPPASPAVVTAGVLPLLRGVLRRHTSASRDDRNLREGAYEALNAVFSSGDVGIINCELSDGGVEMDHYRAAILDFALSAEFDLALQDMTNQASWWRVSKHPSLLLLHQCVATLRDDDGDDDDNNAALARIFAAPRLALVAAFANAGVSSKARALLPHLAGLLACLALRFPAFAPQIAGGRGLEEIFSSAARSDQAELQRNTVLLLDCLLTATATVPAATHSDRRAAPAPSRIDASPDAVDGLHMAQQLLASGALQCCASILPRLALWSGASGGGVGGSVAGNAASGATGRFRKPASAGPSADTVARLLRSARVVLSATEPSPASGEDVQLWRSQAVAPFVACRGLQALELMPYHDCMLSNDGGADDGNSGDGDSGDCNSGDDVSAALREIGLLRALLTRLTATAPAEVAKAAENVGDTEAAAATETTDATETAKNAERRRRTILELRVFSQSFKGGWLESFDAHIACSLDEAGYPPQFAYNSQSTRFEPLPALARLNGAPPSAAALALLQARARESVFATARSSLKANEQAADVRMNAMICTADPEPAQRNFRLVIRLDDEGFPSNAAHFRVAAKDGALGNFFHRCFIPSDQSAEKPLPFVTIYHKSTTVPCATAIALPSSDIVYGEYSYPAAAPSAAETAASAAAESDRSESNAESESDGESERASDIQSGMYSAGTVLLYPRAAAAPSQRAGDGDTFDTPWFLVVRQCPASLLRGAVPVGRVMTCVADGKQENHDSGDESRFFGAVLQWLEAQCKNDSCLKTDDFMARSFVQHEGFVAK